MQMVMVLLSAHADCINMNFSYVSCVTTECTVKTQWCISLLLGAIWDSFDHLLSSNLWANNCHRHLVMTHFIDIIYCPPRSTSITAGCQKMWPLLSFIFTPLNEHSHSLNLFLLIFTFFPASGPFLDGSIGQIPDERVNPWSALIPQ